MANNYERGYQFEYRTKKIFEENGFLVTRSPASQSAADLYIMHGKNNYLAQCKTTKKDRLYIYELGELKEIAEENNAIPLLIYSFNYTPPYVKEVKKSKEKLKKDKDHKKLREFVEEIKENK